MTRNKCEQTLKRLRETEEQIHKQSALSTLPIGFRHASLDTSSTTLSRDIRRNSYKYSASVDHSTSSAKLAADNISDENRSCRAPLPSDVAAETPQEPIKFENIINTTGAYTSCDSVDSVESFITADASSSSSCEMYTPPRYSQCNCLRVQGKPMHSCGSCNSLPIR